MRRVLCLWLAATWAAAAAPPRVRIDAPTGDPAVSWAIEKLGATLASAGYRIDLRAAAVIEIAAAPGAVPASAHKPEGFHIRADGRHTRITGYDGAGALYGTLELARRIRVAGRIPAALDTAESPAMSLRGTCVFFMKLGTYDYPVTPAEFPFFYDRALWLEYLDFLAENRFNYIAFWNGHPFDYFVRLPRFPEAQDGMPPGLVERNHDMLAWLADEARKRNIWLMFQFYNIHTSVFFQKAHGLPAWNPRPTPLLADYTGYAIERFVSEFPNVGLYICPGEALRLEYTDGWINDVVFPAVRRTGKTPPIMIRAWGIDLAHMRKVAGNYPRLYTERKFNVEMVASTEIDPENAEWARLAGNHVVNVHCVANLEPFRWSGPSFIRACVRNSVKAGGTGLHLYPRKVWRWPYGCDRGAESELQWNRDWMWFEAWGRYAWNPERGLGAEEAYWRARLAQRYGNAEAGAAALRAFEEGADVLPAIQRLVWAGNDNHTVVAAGLKLEQLAAAKGIPFLPLPGLARIPAYLEAAAKGAQPAGESPAAFLSRKVAEAGAALTAARRAAALATQNRDDAARLATDAEAVELVARFYLDKLQAAAARARGGGAESLRFLRASVNDFRALTTLTRRTYESLSDVPAWNPVRELPCPYHWTHLLPFYEKELAEAEGGGASGFTTVEIPGRAGAQKALWWTPAVNQPVPLLVALHTWSGDYLQRDSLEYLRRAQARGWALIHPDFRGPNVRPEACGSDLAVEDVVAAVRFAQKAARIDPRRIYLAGVSGGGYMALLMAARRPEIWAAVTSWAPITDLAAWHAECTARGLKYARDLEQVFGGPPAPGEAEREYRRRSPLFHLGTARGLPLDINEGIHDGHTGSVPISHALHAFNVLAGPGSAIPEEPIRYMVEREQVPPGTAPAAPDPAYAKRVLFRREAGPARVTLFEGGHEILYDAAFEWLARHARP